MSGIKLTYFNVRGRAEPARLILAQVSHNRQRLIEQMQTPSLHCWWEVRIKKKDWYKIIA